MRRGADEQTGERTDGGGVERAAEVVCAGGVIVYPTETVYGLGCDPTDADAVARVRAVKGRDADRPMLALTDAWGRVEAWLAGLTDAHRRLMQHDPPLPVTLVFDASGAAPRALVSTGGTRAGGTVGLRRTSDLLCRALIAVADRPLLSTSANRAGRPPASRFADLDPAVAGAADLALDAGHALGGTPSTVVRIDRGRCVVLREGAVDAATVRAIAEGTGTGGAGSGLREPV